jgi:hypothetical protein
LLILKSDNIKISVSRPAEDNVNCFRGFIKEINPSEYGMEVTADAGEIFYVDMTINEFKALHLTESSEVWITFAPEAAISLPGTG